MDKFNTNNSSLDCSALEDLFVRQGTLKEFARNDYFLRQNDHTRYIGYVVSGMFRLSRVDANANDFVCDYPAMRQGSEASVNIQAAVDSAIYLLPWENLNVFWETDMDTQRLGRTIAETMFSEIAQRLYGFYDTPEQRYIRLMQRCPRIQERLTLKEIASFLGVTPETVSRIRKHLLFK